MLIFLIAVTDLNNFSKNRWYSHDRKTDLQGKEAKNLIAAIAESIAQIVERDWAEIEIRKCRKKIEEILKQN